MLRVESVSVLLGENRVLDAVDVAVADGETVALLGPSGSGKSTLLRAIAGLEPLTTGRVSIAGADLDGVPPHRRGVGLMFQDDALFPHTDVRGNVEFGLRMAGMPRAGREARVEEVLALVGLRDLSARRVSQLSGGEQQRVAVAAAVVGSPALIGADEPTAELDSVSGTTLMDLLGDLADTGVSFVVATHDPVVMRKSDRILSLRHGALEAETRADRSLSVIDAFGRIQLPPGALPMFPDHRAVITVEDGQVRITPP